MKRLSATVSDGLHRALAEACERSGRSMTAEIEARLRLALDVPGSDRILLLKFDEGLWDWLGAYERGISMWGNLHDTVVAMIRTQIMEGDDDRRGDAGRWHRKLEMMFPFLPERIRSLMDRPKP